MQNPSTAMSPMMYHWNIFGRDFRVIIPNLPRTLPVLRERHKS